MASYTPQFPEPDQAHPQQMPYMQAGQGAGHHKQDSPRPMYFITRSNGSIVPLVPVDELPFSIRLEGAPRHMTPDQTNGMQFLGTFQYTGMLYKKKDVAPGIQRTTSYVTVPMHVRQSSAPKQYLAPDALARQAITNAPHHSHNLSLQGSIAQRSASEDSEVARPLKDPQAIIDAIVNSKSGAETAARVGYVPNSATPAATPPSGKIPDANKKTHCTYWIRTGECDYTQQGCMYKHEMPDAKGLMDLGFRSTPQWYLEKNQAIRLGAGFGSGGAGKRPTVGPPIKTSDWLRKASVATTDSEHSESDEEKVASTAATKKSVSKIEKEDKNEKSSEEHQGKLTVLKKSVQNNEVASNPIKATSGKNAQNEIDKTGDLIDLDLSEPSSSSNVPTATPPTSADSSPRMSPTTPKQSTASPKSVSARSNQRVFIPKGESKTRHLADHALRHQQRRSRQPSPTQLESLEKQIQRAQKSKHFPATRENGEDATGRRNEGLLASRHAPPHADREEPKKTGRPSSGLRPRRAPLQCVDIPTKSKMMQEDGAAEKK